MHLPFGSKIDPKGGVGFGHSNRGLVSIWSPASRSIGFVLIDLLRFRWLCLSLGYCLPTSSLRRNFGFGLRFSGNFQFGN
jgi:hypothetical protein